MTININYDELKGTHRSGTVRHRARTRKTVRIDRATNLFPPFFATLSLALAVSSIRVRSRPEYVEPRCSDHVHEKQKKHEYRLHRRRRN